MIEEFGSKLKEKLIELHLPETDRYAKYLQDYFGTYPFPIIGCSLEEIEEVKQGQGVKRLPSIYHQFLLEMGQQSADLYVGSDVHYRYLPRLKDAANRRLQFNGLDTKLPDDAFVFFSHQGHTFMYFHIENEDKDPPVYMYRDDDGELDNPFIDGPIKKWDRLSQFLTLFIAERDSKEAQQDFLAKYTGGTD